MNDMRPSLVILALAILLVSSWAGAQGRAGAELLALLDTAVTTRAEADERRRAVGAWKQRYRSSEDLEIVFLQHLARCSAVTGEERLSASRALLAEVQTAETVPVAGFDAHIGRALLACGLDSTVRGQWDDARVALDQVLRFYDDPKSAFWLFGRRARDHADPAGRAFLQNEIVPRLLVDPRTSDTHRVHVLRKLYGVTYHGPKPLHGITGVDLDGNPRSLSDYRGRVVLVDFWATWCVPCLRAMPDVVAAKRKYGARGFDVLGISLDKPDAVSAIRKVEERFGMDWPQLYDGGFWQTKWAVDNGVLAVPATYLIDQAGRVRFTNLGGAELGRRIEELLAEGGK